MLSQICDHLTPFVSIKNNKSDKITSKIKPYRKLDKETLQLISIQLSLLDTDCMEQMDTNEAYEYLTSSITKTLDEIAPLTLPKTGQKRTPKTNQWMTKGLTISNKTKHKLLNKWINKKTLINKTILKTYTKLYNKVLAKSKYLYCYKFFEQHKDNSRLLWDKSKEYMGNKKI